MPIMMMDQAQIPAIEAQSDDAALIALRMHGRPATTTRVYTRKIVRFLAFTGFSLRGTTLRDVQAFADSLIAAELASSTRGRILATVVLSGARQGFAWSFEDRCCAAVFGIWKPHRIPHEIRAMQNVDAHPVLSDCLTSDRHATTMRSMMECASAAKSNARVDQWSSGFWCYVYFTPPAELVGRSGMSR